MGDFSIWLMNLNMLERRFKKLSLKLADGPPLFPETLLAVQKYDEKLGWWLLRRKRERVGT